MMNSQKSEFISVKCYVLSVRTKTQQLQGFALFCIERLKPIIREWHLAAKKHRDST